MLDPDLALLCSRLCRDIYREFLPEFRFPDLPELQPQFIESMDAGFTDIHVAILTDETTNRLYAVFRGSDKLIDWFNAITQKELR